MSVANGSKMTLVGATMIERPCFTPGCPTTTSGQFCAIHAAEDAQRKQRLDDRPSASKRGYGAKWQRKRKAFLKRPGNELCHCGKPATDVDHIEAVDGPQDPLFWDEGNWCPLCHGCHSAKTNRQDGGFGNPSTKEARERAPAPPRESGFRIA